MQPACSADEGDRHFAKRLCTARQVEVAWKTQGGLARRAKPKRREQYAELSSR